MKICLYNYQKQQRKLTTMSGTKPTIKAERNSGSG